MGPGLASARWKLRWYTGSGTTCGQNETSEDVVLSFFHHFPTKRKRDELTFVRSSKRKWFLFLSGIISLLSLSAPFFLSSTQFTPLLLFLFHPFTLFYFSPVTLIYQNHPECTAEVLWRVSATFPTPLRQPAGNAALLPVCQTANQRVYFGFKKPPRHDG